MFKINMQYKHRRGSLESALKMDESLVFSNTLDRPLKKGDGFFLVLSFY